MFEPTIAPAPVSALPQRSGLATILSNPAPAATRFTDFWREGVGVSIVGGKFDLMEVSGRRLPIFRPIWREHHVWQQVTCGIE
jgi:hypothetical protein